MIDDELLAKFDRIQDLPVSEEMLGAYLEDNLSAVENLQIEQQFIVNPEFLTFKSNIVSEKPVLDSLPEEEFDNISLPDLPALRGWHKEAKLSENELNKENIIELHGRNKKTKR